MEENYLSEQIFNMDEISLFWKRMPGRTFIHKRAKSMPGYKACISTVYGFKVCKSVHHHTFQINQST